MRRPPAAIVAGVVTLALLAAASLLAWRSGSALAAHPGGVRGHVDRNLALGLLAGAFAAYLCGLWLVARRGELLRAVLVVVVAVQLVPLAAPLLASTDAWTYWAYGRLSAIHAANPYAVRPSAYPGDPAYHAMGTRWRDRTTLYGPAFTLASEPIAEAAGGSRSAAAWIYKALAAAAAVSASVLAARLAARRTLAAAFVGWNPVLALHAAGGGHNDAWIGALTLLALAAAAKGRRRIAGAAWATAALVKWVPLVFLGLWAVARRSTARRVLPAFAATAGVVVAVASWRYGWEWLRALAPLAENARLETRYAIPHRLEELGLPRGAALALAGVALAASGVVVAVQAARGRPRLALTSVVLLVTTPYLAVWYLAWAVPLAAVEDDDRWSRAAALALCAYLLPQTISI